MDKNSTTKINQQNNEESQILNNNNNNNNSINRDVTKEIEEEPLSAELNSVANSDYEILKQQSSLRQKMLSRPVNKKNTDTIPKHKKSIIKQRYDNSHKPIKKGRPNFHHIAFADTLEKFKNKFIEIIYIESYKDINNNNNSNKIQNKNTIGNCCCKIY